MQGIRMNCHSIFDMCLGSKNIFLARCCGEREAGHPQSSEVPGAARRDAGRRATGQWRSRPDAGRVVNHADGGAWTRFLGTGRVVAGQSDQTLFLLIRQPLQIPARLAVAEYGPALVILG